MTHSNGPEGTGGSHDEASRAIASTGVASLKGSQTDDDKFADAKKAVRYEAVIANWKRYRSTTKPNE